MRVLVLCLEGATVPAVSPELILAFVYGDLDALDGGRCDVREPSTDVVLAMRQTRVRLAHGVGVEARLCRDRKSKDIVAQGPAVGNNITCETETCGIGPVDNK